MGEPALSGPHGAESGGESSWTGVSQPEELHPVFLCPCAFHLSPLMHASVPRFIHSFTQHSLSSPCQVSATEKSPVTAWES